MAFGSTIPSKVIEKVTPVVLKNMDKLQELGTKLITKCNNLPLHVSCNDPRINDIKKLLETITKFIAAIDLLITVIRKVIKALKTVKSAATTVWLAQMFLPLPPFGPPGPIVKLMNILDKLLLNIKSAMPSFMAIIDIIKLHVADVTNVLAIALMILGAICSNETFDASADVNTLLQDRTTNTSTSATSVNNNGDSLYLNTNSGTYDPLTAAPEDLTEYIDLLNDIANDLEDPSKASIYLEEAPTLVYSGTGKPDPSIGKIGDYYFDVANSATYGPKTTDVSWS